MLLLIAALNVSILLTYTWWPAGSHTPVALAHAFVIGSDPVDGSTVSVAPAVVRIFFNEDIGSASIAHVFAPDGRLVEAARSSISRSDPRELDTPLTIPSSLPQGGYTVRWTALSNDDGHTTHGVIGFNIGQSSTGLSGETILGPSTSNILPQLDLFGVLSVAWDWLVLLALTLWVGILVMEGLVLAGEQASSLLARARKQSFPLQWLILAALLIGEIITLILRSTLLTQGLGGNGIDVVALRQLVVETNYGHLWLVRIALVVVALGLLWRTTRQQKSKGITLVRKRSSSRFSRLRRQVIQEQGVGPAQASDDNHDKDKDTNNESSGEETAGERERSLLAPARGATTSSALAPEQAPTRDTITFRSLAGTRLTVAWLVLAGVILLTVAFENDVVQLAQPHVSAFVLSWLYLAAQSMWFGALAYLAYVLLPLLPVAEQAETLAPLLRRLAPAILAMLGVLLVSDLFLSESSLSSAQLLLIDPYGRALLVKIMLTVFMLMLSIYALFFVCPKLARQAVLLPVVDAELPARRTRQSALERTELRLKQSVRLQSWLGAGVLLCAALMAFYAPPIVFPANSYAVSTTTPSTTTINAQTQQVGNLAVTLQVLPGRVDYANTVLVTINDSHGNPVTDAQVQLITNMELMDMGTARVTVKGGNPTYIATFDKDATAFSMSGVWDITVRIQRPNQAVVQAVFKVTFA